MGKTEIEKKKVGRPNLKENEQARDSRETRREYYVRFTKKKKIDQMEKQVKKFCSELPTLDDGTYKVILKSMISTFLAGVVERTASSSSAAPKSPRNDENI